MNRTDAITYLTTQFTNVFSAVGFDVADLEVALANVLDDTLLALGVPYADLASAVVADADVIGFRAALRWFALKAAYDAALAKVDVSISDPSVSKSYSQMVSNLEKARDKAALEAGAYVSSADTGFTTGAIVFGEDYLGEFRRARL